MHTKRYNFVLVKNHFECEGQRKVILNEKHETHISQLQIMQKQEIVHLFFGKKICGFGGHFWFCKFEDEYRTLSD